MAAKKHIPETTPAEPTAAPMPDIPANHPDRGILIAEAEALAALAAQQAAVDQGEESDDKFDAFHDRVRAADAIVFDAKPRTVAGAAAVLRRVLSTNSGMCSATAVCDDWMRGLRNALDLIERFDPQSVRAPRPAPETMRGILDVDLPAALNPPVEAYQPLSAAMPEPIPPNHPDRIILEAERALLAVVAQMEGPDTGNTEKECNDAARLMKRMFRERPRTAMGAAAIIRTFCNPEIGLDAATITNDGSDLMALQGVLGLLEMLPIEAAYESPVLGRFLSLGEGLVVALEKVRDRLSGLAKGIGSEQLRDLAGELDRVTSELAASWRKEQAFYDVIRGHTPTDALLMGVRRPNVRSPAERAAERALAEVESMKARIVPMRVTDLADSLGCLVDACNALEVAIEGLGGGSPDAREVGVHALSCHVAAMAETLRAAVGGREPRGEPDGSRLNTAHWLCPDLDEQEDGRSVEASPAAEAAP